MKQIKTTLIALLLASLTLTLLSGCGSTSRSENGVGIKQNRTSNPFSWF